MSDDTNYKPGFRIVPGEGTLTVQHGHGHYHSSQVPELRQIEMLVTVLKSGKSEEEKTEIENQLNEFLSSTEQANRDNLLQAFSEEFVNRLRQL